jgi:hypothetical protein
MVTHDKPYNGYSKETMVELLLILVTMLGLALVGRFAGADSRPCFDERQPRQI